MHHFFKSLTKEEHRLFKSLNSPRKIQDFIELLPINFEKKGDTLFSPRQVIKNNSAHCLEGALFALAALKYHGKPAILLDMQPGAYKDDGHAVALFKMAGKWGAISKTNHAVLRYREPVYDSPREIVMSYFHEYFLDNGKKTLRAYTVFNMDKIKKNWIVDEDIWYVDKALDKAKYTEILTPSQIRGLRKADDIEIEAGKLTEWKK